MALLKKAVGTWNIGLAIETAKEAVAMGIDPTEAIECLGQGMIGISEAFNEGRIYLPQVLAASQAMEDAIMEFEPVMAGKLMPSKGVVIIGTVQGDIHEIGKHVVTAFLRGAGYIVYDLGKDVPPEEFMAAARERGADIIGASALMTTTLVGQKRIIERLNEEKLFNIKTIFGGACCTDRWVKDIGGDAYCACGAEVVKKVNSLLLIR
ncbi:MAG: cobalamin-dependent protein [Methanomassiliicoccus sp.]|nr:cobalamin-dependent protein [Methanomassiliicoccus sp.]